MVGFDQLGGHDNFSTEMLEWRLGVSKAINYRGDISQPPGKHTTGDYEIARSENSTFSPFLNLTPNSFQGNIRSSTPSFQRTTRP